MFFGVFWGSTPSRNGLAWCNRHFLSPCTLSGSFDLESASAFTLRAMQRKIRVFLLFSGVALERPRYKGSLPVWSLKCQQMFSWTVQWTWHTRHSLSFLALSTQHRFMPGGFWFKKPVLFRNKSFTSVPNLYWYADTHSSSSLTKILYCRIIRYIPRPPGFQKFLAIFWRMSLAVWAKRSFELKHVEVAFN